MSTGSPAAAGLQAGERAERTAQYQAEPPQDGSNNLTGQAQEQAQQAAGQVQERAQQAAGQAKNQLREQLEQRSSQAAEQINEQASDFRTVSASLREQGKDGPANAADKLAGYAEKVGAYLRDHDSDALLADAEDYGRRQPWAVAAGSVVLGFAASRFLKASASRRYAGRSETQATTSSPAAESYRPTPEYSGGVSVPAPPVDRPLGSPAASPPPRTPGI